MKRALIIIDVQEAFNSPKWGVRNNLQAEENIRILLSLWRKTKQEVIYIQHTSKNPDSLFHPQNPGFKIKDMVRPLDGEKVITKEVNSAFIETNLEDYLLSKGITELVITGLTTAHCVSTSTRMSGNLGYTTFLLSDATATFGLYDHHNHYIEAETIHHVSLATIHKEFATVLTTESYIKEFLT
ncbi:cysteine hydrolase family protein [Litchfieldia salsa]|uniref:Nicotinamidase-related amidase n=1 Tax=Litchfieldia salsa TaxID=930152 RepID=A0A1H0Q326_9BACI|nr:cysteine hydrolase family protein [Litchfieldia salsa]SDP11500.1 Nicotinamidase-related amidase [Litchfieldia salsa]